MISKILNIIDDVSICKKNGKFLSDKSYGFDTVFFVSKFIKHNEINLYFDASKSWKKAIEYIEDIFQLKKGSTVAPNYFRETLNILEFSNVIKKIGARRYIIQNVDLLNYILERPENAYIFLYLVVYKTFENDKMLHLYEKFCETNDIDKKTDIVDEIHKIFCEKSVSVKNHSPSQWSEQMVKYSIIVFGYVNQQNAITRTFKVKHEKVDINDIALNVAGTKTPIYLPKKNDYLDTFNKDYVTYCLKPYLFKKILISDIIELTLVDNIAQNLADLKLVMQDDVVDGKVLNDEERQLYITDIVNRRNQAIQKRFRKGLFDNNEHKCPVCGFCFEELLIASHIKPYSKCDDTYDAINHFNGLIMCPNHDRLFEDAKHMTIDYESGKIILSETAKNSRDFKTLKDKFISKVYVSNERRDYLKWHNERFISLHK